MDNIVLVYSAWDLANKIVFGFAASSTYITFLFDGLYVGWWTGNDSGSTGDASSTTGETQSPDASAVAAASGAALQTNYDGAPLVCFPSKLIF